MGKNIWIINHYAVKDKGRHPSLAGLFVKNGQATTIFLSSFDHHKRVYLYDEKIKVVDGNDGVRYIYVKSSPAYNNNGIRRILNMLSFCWIIWRNIKKIVVKTGIPTHIIASSVHPFVWELAYHVAKKYKTKFIAEVRDIWPLSLVEVAHVRKNHPLVKLLTFVERRAYKRSDKIVTTMPFAYKHICDSYGIDKDKVKWLPNGIDTDKYHQNEHSGSQLPEELDQFLTSHWCCVYTGSFVESECIPMMLQAFSKIKDKDIYFAIIGGGHDELKLKQLKEDLKLDKVEFFPFVEQSKIPQIMSKAKCCIGAIHDLPIYEYGLSMNKLNDYLISGKPVVFACSYNNVVKDAGHFGIQGEDSQLLADTIIKVRNLSSEDIEQLSQKSKKIIEETYDYKVVAQNYLSLLNSL